MKILFFTFFFPRITETFIINKIISLLKQGVDVQIMAMADPSKHKAVEDRKPEKIIHSDVFKYNLLERTTYIKMINDKPDYRTIKQYFLKNNLDLVHFQWSGLADWILSKIDFSMPVITNFHESVIPKNWPRKVDEFQTIFTKSSLILPVSIFIKNHLQEQGCPTPKLQTHHMGVDINMFKVTKQIKKANEIVFLTVAGLLEKKGHQDALRVMKKIKDQGVNFKYYIVGDGVLREKLEKFVEDNNLQKNVIFTGKIVQQKVLKYYHKSHIFIHPSVTASDGSHEGIPTTIMEASACELPIISTIHTGIPELVIDGKTGFLSREHDIEKMTQDALILVKNTALRKRMGKAGRRIVVRYFNVDKLTLKAIQIYKSYI